MQFKVDGTNVGTPDTSSPYGATWDASGLAAGTTHAITAVATDTSGNATTSATIHVTIGLAAPPPPATTLFGDGSVFTHAHNDPAGSAEAFQYTASASGSLAVLHVYLTTPLPTSLVLGVYADAGGSPGALLAQGTLSAPAAGWNTVTLAAPTALTSGTPFWVALLSPVGSGTVNFVDAHTGGKAVGSAAGLTALLSPWTTAGGPWTDGPASIYGTTS